MIGSATGDTGEPFTCFYDVTLVVLRGQTPRTGREGVHDFIGRTVLISKTLCTTVVLMKDSLYKGSVIPKKFQLRLS
jgi:hypothetical protein